MWKHTRLLIITLVALNLWGCASTEKKEDLKIEREGLVSATATVEGVDMQTRMVTLRSDDGRLFTIYAGKEVVNLPQVRLGDTVVAVYTESLAVRMAKPGEVRDDTGVAIGRAVPGSKPGGFEVNHTTVTAKIVRMDKSLQTVTLELSNGGLRIVKVQDPANLERVKVGETIVITYTNEFAVSVQPFR